MSLTTPLRTLFISAALLTSSLVSAEQAHDFSLQSDSGTVSLTQYKGKVVYLDFWASWCGPCRESFPWMNEMQQRYGAKGFKVIAVNLDKEAALREKFIKKIPPKFTIAFDPEGTTAEKYGVQAMPTSYLIDRQGKIHSHHLGFRAIDSGELEKSIQSLLQ